MNQQRNLPASEIPIRASTDDAPETSPSDTWLSWLASPFADLDCPHWLRAGSSDE